LPGDEPEKELRRPEKNNAPRCCSEDEIAFVVPPLFAARSGSLGGGSKKRTAFRDNGRSPSSKRLLTPGRADDGKRPSPRFWARRLQGVLRRRPAAPFTPTGGSLCADASGYSSLVVAFMDFIIASEKYLSSEKQGMYKTERYGRLRRNFRQKRIRSR